MLIPSSDQPYCYCLSKSKEETMLTCQKCKKLFHLGCLQSGRPTTLLGDIFFELTCAVCNDGEELLSRMKMSWIQVVVVALYNLHMEGVSGKCGYYRWKEHICAFIDKHWTTFFGVTKKKSGNWAGTVAGTLSTGCPSYFKSGFHLLNESGWWCLAEVKPPTSGDDWQAMRAKNRASKQAESADLPVKALRDRRHKTSIQAAIELKAKRDGAVYNADTSTTGPSRKRTFSSSSCADPVPGTSSQSAPKIMRTEIKVEPGLEGTVSHVGGHVEVEPLTVTIKQEPQDSGSSLMDELLRAAGEGASDDDFEVDPCSISPCASPILAPQADVQQLLSCFSQSEPMADFHQETPTPSELLTPSDVTSADVSATSSSDVKRAVMTSSVVSSESDPEDSEAEQSEEEKVEDIPEPMQIRYRPLSVYEEKHLLRKLDHLLENKHDDHAANRLRAKLRLRQIKRERGLPVFDLDARLRQLTNQRPESFSLGQSAAGKLAGLPSSRAGPGDRVLDRFQCTSVAQRPSQKSALTFQQRLIGGATNQLSCIVSPYTTRQLKPYIRRDYQTKPKKLRLLQEIVAYPHRSDPSWRAPETAPIDYSYVRPEHIPSINQLCHQFFWPGIDLSECLQYPDFSCVVLYKKIVIAFAFMVPDVNYNEAYISFIFTHPDWRGAGIGTFMVYHLIQTCLGKDITLHVSATNPAMVLYQKFGFKPEEFVLDFYDKYYPYDSKDCRHAFFLRLRR